MYVVVQKRGFDASVEPEPARELHPRPEGIDGDTLVVRAYVDRTSRTWLGECDMIVDVVLDNDRTVIEIRAREGCSGP